MNLPDSVKHRLFIIAAVVAMMWHTATASAGDTLTGIFDDSFRTLTVCVDGDRLAPPVITLGSSDRLVIGFDQLSDERQYLRYTIVHCNADWQPSDLTDSEVFDGFNYAPVEDYEMSRGTTTHYVHYTIELPNSEYQFRLSGNYLLKVYPEDDPENTLLQVRFMVNENTVAVGGTATSRTDIGFNDTYQQLEIQVDPHNYPIRDPFNDLTIVVQQNYQPATQRVLSHPFRTRQGRLFYEHTAQLIFPGGNEYRRMETVNNLYPGMGVDRIDFEPPYYHHYLKTDRERARHDYRYDQTQHGRFFVREYNSDRSDTEADYVLVDFTLDQTPLTDADILLEGDITYRKLDDSSKMNYDIATGRYSRTMLLKQGAYNYRYVTVPRDGRDGSLNLIEGDKYETCNEYSVAVYYRAPGERYDRLIGYSLIFSGR